MATDGGAGGGFVTPQGGKHSRRPPLLHCWIEPSPRVREALMSAQVRFVDHLHARAFSVEEAVQKGFLTWPSHAALPEPAWGPIRTRLPFSDYPQVLYVLTPQAHAAINSMTIRLGGACMSLRAGCVQRYVTWEHPRTLPGLNLGAIGAKYSQHTPTVIDKPPEDGAA